MSGESSPPEVSPPVPTHNTDDPPLEGLPTTDNDPEDSPNPSEDLSAKNDAPKRKFDEIDAGDPPVVPDPTAEETPEVPDAAVEETPGVSGDPLQPRISWFRLHETITFTFPLALPN